MQYVLVFMWSQKPPEAVSEIVLGGTPPDPLVWVCAPLSNCSVFAPDIHRIALFEAQNKANKAQNTWYF